jgi:hypothetical protein
MLGYVSFFNVLTERHVSTLMHMLHMLLHNISTYYHRISVHVIKYMYYGINIT